MNALLRIVDCRMFQGHFNHVVFVTFLSVMDKNNPMICKPLRKVYEYNFAAVTHLSVHMDVSNKY